MAQRNRARDAADGSAAATTAADASPSSREQRYQRALAAAQQSLFELYVAEDRVAVGPLFWAQIGRPAAGPSMSFPNFLGLVHAEDRPILVEALRRAGEREGNAEAPLSASFRIATPVGDVREFTIGVAGGSSGDTAEARIVTGVVGDATEARRLRRELVEARTLAETANRTKSEFIATISHEIRTPINGILGMTGLLLDSELTDEQRDFARTVQESGQALLELVTDIIDFSKAEAGKLELEQIEFELPDVIAGAVRMTAARAGAKGLELRWEPDPRLPSGLIGDPGRLRQILLNLISNAIKFTERGAVVVRARPLERKNGIAKVRIEVQDTGIGIDEDQMPKLFRKFSQVDSSIARRYGGTGLGLAVCKNLVDLMAGDIGVDSVTGEGSTFWFEIALPDVGRKLSKARPAAGPRRVGAPVLVVDDNAVNSRLLAALLGKLGHAVGVVDTGWKAVEAARQGAYGLVLMDLQLPGLDGYEAAAAIRALPSRRGEVPIVAVTGDSGEGDRERYRHSAINEFLLKPVDNGLLGEVVRRWAGAWVERSAPSTRPSQRAAGDVIYRSVLNALTDRLGADKTGELINLYVTDLKERVEHVGAALAARDAAALHREAHDLRSTSGSLGFTRLFALGEGIQNATQRGNDADAFAIAAKVAAVSEETIAALLAADPRVAP